MTLIVIGEVVSDDKMNAESFNNIFVDAVSSVAIEENKAETCCEVRQARFSIIYDDAGSLHSLCSTICWFLQ